MVQAHWNFRRAGALAVVAAALAAPQGAAADVVAGRVADPGRGGAAAYWTPARIAAAEPAGEVLELAPVDSLPATAVRQRRARRAAQPVSNPGGAPQRTHGKVFFSLGGTPYQCSGTVVRAKTKRLVATAGHCVFDQREGGFARNWVFIPAKSGGSEPYGRWTARRLATTSQWADSTRDSNINNDDVRFDVGFATLRKRNGKRLQNVVGARRVAFDLGRDLHFDAFGYPAQDGFSGSEPYVCSSKALGKDGGPPPQATRIDCNMTGGASGGGWIAGGGRLNSVTSYGYECSPVDLDCLINGNPEEDRLFGPYFGAAIRNVYRSERR